MKDLNVEIRRDDETPVLTVDYGADQMFLPQSSQTLSEKLLALYRQEVSDQPDKPALKGCIIVINADSAGSPLVRALFELYKVVNADGGQLFCVSYPDDYIDSLTSLGLTVLPGFHLAASKAEALKKLRTPAE